MLLRTLCQHDQRDSLLCSPRQPRGNGSESASDLHTYLDNFFSPGGQMPRWYHFRNANYAYLFALDSTTNRPIRSTISAF